MEISKALQEEILSVQNKLKNAIRDHQVCVVKLKDDPNNTDILDRIREIQLHIVSLGRWQKQVVQRLRKEVESLKVENSLNGTKISVAALLGLNNNNHITNNNEATRKVVDAAEHGKSLNGHVETQAKEDYEEIVRNGDVASPLQDGVSVKERRSTSVEPASGDDEVVEVPTGTSSPVDSIVLETEIEEKPKLAREQQCFLGCLGLITTARLIELQHKRAERKRRSTANSHFVYSNWEVPMKRKRHAYLQSLGDAPQTRQTTARLNGPSPPPTKSRSCSSAGRAATKSLIQATKTAGTAKPNILRNGDGKQKEVFVKSVKQEDKLQAKLVPTTSTGKTVHIPGLPSCLTIERIENDSTVCITCRNPGTLTVCESCSSKFHVSCHTITPASSYYCPKCMARFRSTGLTSAHLEILRRDVENIKKEKDTEEREKVRYELRERNADLRIQVYELEKRSQLISQSLQLQQRTRLELLGKQEKTQRSIKRLVDFIKLMQLRPDNTSPLQPLESTSCPPQLSSYQSLPPTTTSPSLPSTSRSESPPPLPPWDQRQDQRHRESTAESLSNSPRSSSASFRSRASPSPSCCSKPVSPSQTSSSRKSPDSLSDKDDGVTSVSSPNKQFQFSTMNDQEDQKMRNNLRVPRTPSPVVCPSLPSKLSATKTNEPAKAQPTVLTCPKARLECPTLSTWSHPEPRLEQTRQNTEIQRVATSPLEAPSNQLTHPSPQRSPTCQTDPVPMTLCAPSSQVDTVIKSTSSNSRMTQTQSHAAQSNDS